MFAAHFIINVKDGNVDAFLQACIEEAEASIRDEPNCHRFDIFRDQAASNRFHFLEIFSSAEDLEAHYKTPHFLKMWGIIESMIEGDLQQVGLDPVFSTDPAIKS